MSRYCVTFSATSVPSFFAPASMSKTWPRPCVVVCSDSVRVSIHFTGRPLSLAAAGTR